MNVFQPIARYGKQLPGINPGSTGEYHKEKYPWFNKQLIRVEVFGLTS